jgi:hypothetical protein
MIVTLCALERHGGELWILNLPILRVGGFILIHLGCMGWGYGRILGVVGECFLLVLDLNWEMAVKSDFEMMCGVGRWPLRKISWIYVVLLV